MNSSLKKKQKKISFRTIIEKNEKLFHVLFLVWSFEDGRRTRVEAEADIRVGGDEFRV